MQFDGLCIIQFLKELVIQEKCNRIHHTGSGKTKLAETLSHLFSQPMHSVNCSVDLDAEALLGFKTISDKKGKQVSSL